MTARPLKPIAALAVAVAAVPVLAFGLLTISGAPTATPTARMTAGVTASNPATPATALAVRSAAPSLAVSSSDRPTPLGSVGSPIPAVRSARPTPASDPVIAAAGDIACDPGDGTLRPDGEGSPKGTSCMQMATAKLLAKGGYAAVLPLGDDQYYCGSLAAFQKVYGPSWGQVKSITHPVPGNHEYITAPGTVPATGCDESNDGASGYFGYFGPLAGEVGKGWYSYDIGAWHLIALNSQCSAIAGCDPNSPEGNWLAADLAAHRHQCLLAYWHVPLFSSGGRAAPDALSLWNQVYAAGADVVLNGHDHIYERFAPQDASGAPDPAHGITEFIVGTGGSNHTAVTTVVRNSVVRDVTSFGILAMTLRPTGMDWRFIPATGRFADSGSLTCHNV